MASTIVNFPSGKKVKTNIVTAYKVANGMDILVTETGNIENGNNVVGVSYKPVNEECYTKIVNLEDWKRVKESLVDNIHNKKENFVYQVVAEEINATEEFVRELALRDENFRKLLENYATYLKSLQPEEEKQADIVPFPTQEVETPVASQVEQPEVSEVSVAPEVASVEETVLPDVPVAPVIDNGVQEIQSVIPNPEVIQPNLEETNHIVEFPNAPAFNEIVEEQPKEQVAETPIVNEVPNQESVAVTKEANQSVVKDSYLNTAEEIIVQMRELTNKYLQTMEEMAQKMENNLKETDELKGMYVGAVDKAEQILAFQTQNEDATNSISRAA